jgi:hypothetical protein
VAVLIGPNCNSACEFFAYDMTVQDRASVVGQYPTGGLGGSIDTVLMPEAEFFRYTAGRAVDMNGDIHIEGKGVPPTVKVPVTEETLFSDGDPVLDAAIDHLVSAGEEAAATAAAEAAAIAENAQDGGELAIGDNVEGEFAPGQRVRYTLPVVTGDVVSIYLGDEAGELDTVLRLYDTDGNLLLESDEGGGNASITDLEIPVDLTLVIEAATADDAGEGAYTLRVEEGQAP